MKGLMRCSGIVGLSEMALGLLSVDVNFMVDSEDGTIDW